MNIKIIFCTFLIAFFSCNFYHAQENYRTLVYEGNKKFENKDYEGASSRYMEAAKVKDKDFTAHYNLGNALYKSKKYDEAKAEFEKASQYSQNSQDKTAALYNLGNTYMQSNQPEKAAEYYKQALKNEPKNETARKNYEIAMLKDKENKQKQQEKQDKNKNSGKGEGKDQQKSNEQGKGDEDANSKGGNQQQPGEGENGNQPDPNKKNDNNSGKMPKDQEDAILNKVGDKEKETARRILNKNSYSMPESNEKDW
jgi:tetratricopeptide (TPR) repeat protein